MYLHSEELTCEQALLDSLAAGREKKLSSDFSHSLAERPGELDLRLGEANFRVSKGYRAPRLRPFPLWDPKT